MGNYAIGLMEGKNLVKEIAIRKGTRIRPYIDGRTYTVDYEVVDTKHFSHDMVVVQPIYLKL